MNAASVRLSKPTAATQIPAVSTAIVPAKFCQMIRRVWREQELGRKLNQSAFEYYSPTGRHPG
jgi:hypothetical protein